MSEATRTHATMIALQIAELQTKVMSPSDYLAFCAQVDDFLTGDKTEMTIETKTLRVVPSRCADSSSPPASAPIGASP